MIPVYRLPGWKGHDHRPAHRVSTTPDRRPWSYQVVPHRLRHAAQHQQLQLHPRLPRLLRLVGRSRLSARPDRPDPRGHAVHHARVRHAQPQVRLHHLARATKAAAACATWTARRPLSRRRHRQQLLGPAPLRRRGCAGHDLLLRCAARPGRPGGADRRSTRSGASPTGADAFDPADLRRHAAEVKDYGTKRFWNEKTGRFGTVDLDGSLHDYGFTFLNNEAVYYGFATPEQARSIHAWIAGERTVEGDTSSGADIYHWRFGPRSTTRRNLDYYFWAWSGPEIDPVRATRCRTAAACWASRITT